MPRSKEGYLWTPQGSSEGLETEAVVPSTKTIRDSYDVVVIGAGFAGLIAARDVSRHTNLKVLLVEARDRIGGRTWTASALGESFEMGGTWIHWNQPHVYREIHRYGLERNLKTSAGTFAPTETLYRSSNASVQAIDTAATFVTLEAIATAFFEMDGHTSRSLLPFPHDPLREPSPWRQYDHLSVRDRLDQMTQFSEADKQLFESNVASLGSAPGEDIGFVEFLRWYALGGHSLAQMFELCGVYKLGKGGMTSLARGILSEFKGDLLMEASLTHLSQEGSDKDQKVTLRFEDGRQIVARSVVCTIPLNCLKHIQFAPPLSPLRTQAIQKGHINRGAKIHFKLSAIEPGWFGTCATQSDSPFCFAFSDHNGTKPGNDKKDGTYCIGFGFNDHLTDKRDHETIIKQFRTNFKPDADVQAYLTHDWMNDRFANGVWCCWGPNAMSEYLEELQRPHGRVLFANADWADGWRGFVDGAIAEGGRRAREVVEMLGS